MFGFDDDFFRDFFKDERIKDDIRRMAEEMMRMFTNVGPGKPIVHGIKIYSGPDGKPRIEDFGNRPERSSKGNIEASDKQEPLTDVIEQDEDVTVTVEIPGVEKEHINLYIKDNTLDITVNHPERKYHKLLDLPCEVKPKITKATYKNGILDIIMKRKHKKKSKDGYKVNIE
jgi:HSP20 family protein